MAWALSAALAAPFDPGLAKSFGTFGGLGSIRGDSLRPTKPGDEHMLLEADQLVYDFDNDKVTAIGDVQIYYHGYSLDADKVEYDQKSGRLIATGGIRMLEPGGNIFTTDKLDITDNFRDGFVGSLNLITTDRARFTAQSAERRDGNLTIFRKGIYTACQPCLDHPDRPPLWQIKAARIVHDQATHTIYYKDAEFEFFGVPIAYVPVFFHPDPTVQRKTGFLRPSFLQSNALGAGVTTPFFWNIAPDYDVTFSPTYLSRQGLLMQSQWRQRLLNGSYAIRLAGIFQRDPSAFQLSGVPLSGDREFRGSVRTDAAFSVSDHWTLGWDANLTTDRTFNRDYRIPNATDKELPSTIYLTGIDDRNYFDIRGDYIKIQREDTEEDLPDDGNPATPDVYIHNDQAEQAFVHPVIDHNYVLGNPVLGGEVRLDSNFTSVSRDKSDIRHPPTPFDPYYAGVAGTFTRASSRASWRRQFVVVGGQLVMPFTYLQADANWIASNDPAAGLLSNDGATGRAMPAVGVEYQWPFLATLGPTTHTFGPKVQVIARPNERHAGFLPNEDAQSLEFDDTTLFQWDKFSGYDREEGGTRANVGFLYQGLFPNGAAVDALVGRSFQLAGENSFALRDHALTGIGSGLETPDSDYVSRVTVNTGLGVALTARGRFDNDNLVLNRGELSAVGGYGKSTAAVDYTFLRESPASGIFERREELSTAASVEFVDNWSVLGSVVFDLRNNSLVSDSLGLAYSGDCFAISGTYSETTDAYSDIVSSRQLFFRVSLRTLADSGFASQIGPDTTDQ